MDMLDWQAENYSPQVPTTCDGPTSSVPPHGSHHPSPLVQYVYGETRPDLSERKRLNPTFVEWLMGWPLFWTSTEPTGCGAEEMALYRRKLQSLLSSLCGAPQDARESGRH